MPARLYVVPASHPSNAAANGAGIRARSAMDNAMFGPNEIGFFGGRQADTMDLIGSRLPDYIQARRFPPSRMSVVRRTGTRMS